MKNHNLSLGYLHAFIILLLVGYHSFMAYIVNPLPHSSSFSTLPYVWNAFPIIDSRRWFGFDLFFFFNDQFFMPLLFFMSGLFVWPSIKQKGNREFLRGRILRLGLPFIIAAVFISPLAYYPSYRTTGSDPALLAFYRQWLSLDCWPSGPVWFLYLLLLFNFLAVLLRKFFPDWVDLLGEKISWSFKKPILFFCILAVSSAIVYFPMQIIFGKYGWSQLGFFQFQTSRILLYAVYFITGISVGSYGLNKGLLAHDGKLARRWPAWLAVSLVIFVITLIATMKSFHTPRLSAWNVIYASSFILFCALCGLSFLGLFIRLATRRRRIFDSLHENAFGIYLIHYFFVVWLQYAVLNVNMHAAGKGAIVFSAALSLSWVAAIALRKIPAVSRVISYRDNK